MRQRQFSLHFAAACGLRSLRQALRRWRRRVRLCRRLAPQCAKRLEQAREASAWRAWLQLSAVLASWERPRAASLQRLCVRAWLWEARLSAARHILLLQAMLRWRSAVDSARSLQFKMRRFHASCAQASAMLAARAAGVAAAALRGWSIRASQREARLRGRCEALARARTRPLRLALEGFRVHLARCQQLRHACGKLECAALSRHSGLALTSAFKHWCRSNAIVVAGPELCLGLSGSRPRGPGAAWSPQGFSVTAPMLQPALPALPPVASPGQATIVRPRPQLALLLAGALSRLQQRRLSQAVSKLRQHRAKEHLLGRSRDVTEEATRRSTSQAWQCFDAWVVVLRRRDATLGIAAVQCRCRAALRRLHRSALGKKRSRRRAFLAEALARRRFLRWALGAWLRAGISETWAARRGLERQLAVVTGAPLPVVPVFAPLACAPVSTSRAAAGPRHADRLALWAAAVHVATTQGGG